MKTKKSKGRRQALGKGLGALLPSTEKSGDLFLCPIEKIFPSRQQPRHGFDDEDIEELAQSIREQGLIQPLVVRREKDGYEIIAGERRWRACQKTGMREVPVVIHEASSKKAFEMALVENIQRTDLNPIEEAEALGRLLESHGYTQEEAAAKVGKSRTAVANIVRLLRLPEKVRKLVAAGELSEGHARALLGLKNQSAMTQLAERAVRRAFSVRELEKLAREKKTARSSTPGRKTGQSPQMRSLIARLEKSLGVRVKIIDEKGSGRLELYYTSLDVFDRLLDRLLGNK